LFVSLAVYGGGLDAAGVVEGAEVPDIEGDQLGQAASGEQCGEDDGEVAFSFSSGVWVVALSVVSAVISFSTASWSKAFGTVLATLRCLVFPTVETPLRGRPGPRVREGARAFRSVVG